MTTETLTPTEPRTAPLERTASDVLLAAARYIEEHGWYQGYYAASDGSGRVCVVGALRAVLTGTPLPADDDFAPSPAADVFWEAITKLEDLTGVPSQWNDQPGRTRDDVLAALRAAAAVS